MALQLLLELSDAPCSCVHSTPGWCGKVWQGTDRWAPLYILSPSPSPTPPHPRQPGMLTSQGVLTACCQTTVLMWPLDAWVSGSGLHQKCWLSEIRGLPLPTFNYTRTICCDLRLQVTTELHILRFCWGSSYYLLWNSSQSVYDSQEKHMSFVLESFQSFKRVLSFTLQW